MCARDGRGSPQVWSLTAWTRNECGESGQTPATPCIMHLMCNFHLKVKILPGDPLIAEPALPSPST